MRWRCAWQATQAQCHLVAVPSVSVQSRVAEALALVEAILNEDGPNHDEIIMERSEIIKLERVRPGFAFDITV